MRDLRVVTKRWRENEPTGPQISLDRLKEASVSDDAIAMLSGTPRTDGRFREDDVFIVYPHRGFLVALGSACLLMGVAYLIAAIVIIPSDPLGSMGATSIGSLFCLGGWYVLACRDSPQITVSERGVVLHRDDPVGRKLGRTRVQELAWADIRTVEAEMRVKASSRYFMWGITISFVLRNGSRKRHVAGYAGVSTKRLLTEMKRFADMGGYRIEWPPGLESLIVSSAVPQNAAMSDLMPPGSSLGGSEKTNPPSPP
jgi:hypothetical protein